MTIDLLEALWGPVSPENPAGPDLALAPELDAIRSAREGEDGGLAQGDWIREFKAPQWPRVRELCESILRERSKDLQVACWYVEALTNLDGFPGLALGLQAVEGLLDRYWDSCHPALERDSAEARAGRIEWLDAHLALTVRQIPLTAPDTSFSWLRWEEARRVDNLGLQSPQARDEALREGKLAGETFHKAMLASGPDFCQMLQDQAQAARERCRSLQATLGRRFGAEGPGLETLAAAIQDCVALLAQARMRHFPPPSAPGLAEDGTGSGTPAQASEPFRPGPLPSSRTEAIRGLRAAAAFFRSTEPHSPVAFLVERAANWAEMPLETWLAEVIKDQDTLAQLKELLNMK